MREREVCRYAGGKGGLPLHREEREAGRTGKM